MVDPAWADEFGRLTSRLILGQVATCFWEHIPEKLPTHDHNPDWSWAGWLGPVERALWRKMKAGPRRLAQWLSGRLAAKVAVMELLQARTGQTAVPTDIEILPDEVGRPLVGGEVRKRHPEPLRVSLAHTRGAALAAAAVSAFNLAPAVDIEFRDRVLSSRLLAAAFTPTERDLMADLDDTQSINWPLRLWCAKEVASKAVGSGLVGLTRCFTIGKVTKTNGDVSVNIDPGLAARFMADNITSVTVNTWEQGDYLMGMIKIPGQAQEANASRNWFPR